MRAGLQRPEDIPPEIVGRIGTTSSSRINAMIRDTIRNSMEAGDIRMSTEMRKTLTDLRSFMFQRVYASPVAEVEHEKAEKIVGDLFAFYMEHPEKMSQEFRQLMEEGDPVRQVVCDYIACMTDRFAVAKYNELFIPKEWSRL